MEIKIPPSEFDQIAKLIGSEASPVGIDAIKTHVIIIQKLLAIEQRLEKLEREGRSD